MATLLQIVCAEGERFARSGELEWNAEDVRRAAEELATNLDVKEPGPRRPLAHRRNVVQQALEPLLASLKSSMQAGLEQTPTSEEFRWLKENTRILNAALQDTLDVAKIKYFPHVRTDDRPPTPRIIAIAEAFLRAVDFRFDALAFAAFLDAIQETVVLNVDETWALIPCFKLLLLDELASRSSLLLEQPEGVYGVADCIRSLHHIGQTSWKSVLEPRILIDRVLRDDPAGAYALMDFESRDRYWHAIAAIAARADLTEMEIAIEALSLAQEARIKSGHIDARLLARRSHVGCYIIGEGLPLLQRKVGFRPSLPQKITSLLRRHPNVYYLSGICLGTIAVTALVLLLVTGVPHGLVQLLLAISFLLLPASQIAVEMMTSLTTWLMPVQLLPKFDFAEGIPPEYSTVVVVPVLLLNEPQVREQVEQLEILYLANRDPNLHFALLTDLPDSREQASEDDPRIALCAELIAKLNGRYADEGRGAFLLLHRHRTYNPHERLWMGWERKRGKLMNFATLLRQGNDSFAIKVGNLSLLSRIRFIITLDADTNLPRGEAHHMIGALAHPLNQAIFDSRDMPVLGYGVLQPRLGVSLQSAARSRLANILAGERGLDIYTRAVSNVYQDLFGDAIFTGKGIWEVDTLLRSLNRRFPDNALLSHDLIEGVYARTGLCSDIELVDDFPSTYTAFSKRKHRWTRGDWQVAEWLGPRVKEADRHRVPNPLTLISRWKIFDNLRRSLIEPATALWLLFGWVLLPGSATRWTLAALALTFAPPWIHFVISLLRSAWKRNAAIIRQSLPAFQTANAAALFRLTFLLHQAVLSFDAIARFLVRRMVTHHGLLQWETAAETELNDRRKTLVDFYLTCIPVLAIALGVVLWVQHPPALWAAAPILLLWAANKPISEWLNRPRHKAHYEISTHDRLFLRNVALRTWRYFAEHSNYDCHWLIPDNLRQSPTQITERTSPTDIGLLLNTRQVACEMGYLTIPEFVDLTERSLEAIEALPKYRGHLFNWYSTRTLEPLPPAFISSADSGNLAAALWSLREGGRERLGQSLLSAALLEGFDDNLRVLGQHSGYVNGTSHPDAQSSTPGEWLEYMRRVTLQAHCSSNGSGNGSSSSRYDLRWFSEEVFRRQEAVASTMRRHCPWLLPEFSVLRDDPTLGLQSSDMDTPLEQLPAFIDALMDRLGPVTSGAADQRLAQSLQVLLPEARQNTIRLIRKIHRIIRHAGQLVANMDFHFLLSRQRNLLSVGYDVDSKQLMTACYDLLASEARMAAFVAIAKENISQETWFLLGRTHTLNSGHPVLMSWTGTMFEYLMPSLWMRTFPETLLARAHAQAVRSQQAYAAGKHIPWGISESAYSKSDGAGNYLYSAFGVPDIALREPDSDCLVISPYSTLLALPVDTVSSLQNLHRMAKEGWLGQYGFYDAADYTAGPHSSRHRPYQLVCCWMAHHQGMSLLALANVLHRDVVQRWFHNNRQVQATERLLQEKPVAWADRDPLRRASEAA